MKKLKDLLNESVKIGKVYSNPYATAFVKENEEEPKAEMELTNEQKAAFFEAVKQFKKYGESVYRNAGLSEVYESIKNMVEVAGKVTISETGDWFDGVTVGRHMKRMGESFKVFEKTLKEVDTLQQRLESSYDEIGEVLGKYYEISELNETDDEIDEGNEFGAARAKAIANGDDSFEVDGKKYPVKDVDTDDKENAKEFTKESMKLTDILNKNKSVNESPVSLNKAEMEKLHKDGEIEKDGHEIKFTNEESLNEGKYDDLLDKLADIVGNAKSFMDIGKELKSNKIKYSFGTSPLPMYIIDKPVKIAILNNKYADGAERVVGTTAIGLMEGMSMNEAKYDIGMARKGNGLTVYNKAEEEKGDYKNVAHIDNKGKIKYLDKKVPSNIKKQIEAEAKKMMEIKIEGTMKLKNLLKESIGIGELPSSKLMKMKVSAKDMLESIGEDDINEARVSAKKLLQSVVDGQTDRVEGIKLSKEMAEAYLNWLRMSPFGKKYGKLPFNKLFPAAFNWGLHRHADEKSKEYKDLKAKAKGLAKNKVDDSVVTEGASTEEKRIVMLAVRKIAKYRNVPINQSVVDVQRAAEELERDIQKGKVKK